MSKHTYCEYVFSQYKPNDIRNRHLTPIDSKDELFSFKM